MSFTGELHWRGDPGYEAARVGRIFNARRPDRYPAGILLAAGEGDVVAGVRLARERGLSVSVRAGGHSWAAWSLRDDALLIDLGAMRDMSFDPATGIASANPAVQGGAEFTPFLRGHGRAFTGGHCPSVGLGGFLLQGGQGWNSRRYGWACEHVVAIDVVTADGELVHADEHENSDLLWAARGAGPGFFGVITRFYLQTYPLPSAMTHDTWMFELSELEPLLAWIDGLLPALDAVVEPVIAATRLPRPEGPPVLLLHTTAMCDTAEEAERVLAPLAECPIADRAIGHERGPTTLEQENEAQALQNPERHRYAVDCTWTDARAAAAGSVARARVVGVADRALVLDLVRLGAEPPVARHGLLGPGPRLSRHLRDLARPGRRPTPPRLGGEPDRGAGHPRDRGVSRRHRLHPAPGSLHGARELRSAAGDPGPPRPRGPLLFLSHRGGRTAQRRTRPPSTHSVCPVTAPAPSEAR